MPAADQVKETAKQELSNLRSEAEDAARSGAYLYPFRGIVYFLAHRALWQPLLAKLPQTLTLGIGITTFMFLFTYLPQMAVMAFTSGPLAAVSAALLVLSESSTLTEVLSKAFLIEDSLIDTFDGTLLLKGQDGLVQKERQIKGTSAGDAIARLGRLAGKPFAKFTPTAMVRYFVFLPLNFIPVVGTVVFVLLQGKRFGPQSQSRYYQLKGMSGSQKERHIEQRRAAYTSFGVPAVLLEMVPVAGIFFAFTNICGAALWAADMESRDTTAPALRDAARKAE